ncbi:MAG: twin-arginine translocation signal domain-containing protein [Gemmatimonadaceae bacterium]
MTLDSVTVGVARRLGNSYSRRSFLGRLGAGLAVVGAGSLGVKVGEAESSTLACCGCSKCGYSTTCGSTPPYCPSGACHCGSWYKCECYSQTKLKRYADCCANCSSCSCGSDGRPRCLYHAPYSSGCGGSDIVKCRLIWCTTYPC